MYVLGLLGRWPLSCPFCLQWHALLSHAAHYSHSAAQLISALGFSHLLQARYFVMHTMKAACFMHLPIDHLCNQEMAYV